MDKFSDHPLYGKHNIDSAMNSLWDFYKSRFITLFLISLGMSLVVQFASSFIDMKDLQSTTDPAEMLVKIKGMIVPILGVSLINLFFTTILQYYILYNPLDKSNNILVSFGKSMRYFIPYLIIMILLAFFGAAAMFLGLFVPDDFAGAHVRRAFHWKCNQQNNISCTQEFLVEHRMGCRLFHYPDSSITCAFRHRFASICRKLLQNIV
jgi:hypothetical protein